MKKKFMIFLAATILMLSLVGCGATGTETSNSGTTSKIYNSDIYEFVDPDTGVHYWIYSHNAGYGGMGGRSMEKFFGTYNGETYHGEILCVM